MNDAQAPLLRDLITIPERVHQGDFVLRTWGRGSNCGCLVGVELRPETFPR
jgi:hypothetical protein